MWDAGVLIPPHPNGPQRLNVVKVLLVDLPAGNPTRQVEESNSPRYMEVAIFSYCGNLIRVP